MSDLPCFYVLLAEVSNLDKKVDTLEQDVDIDRPKRELSLLCGDETILHRVRHPDSGVNPDDSCSPFK